MSVKLDTPAENIELKTNRLTVLDDVKSHDEGYPTGLAAKEYTDEACSSKENAANKITEISDDQTYGAEKYPNAEAVKEYVAGHEATGYEVTANKATVIDDTADNTKYPTTLAVKNAVEAIPASPATKTRVVVTPEDIEELSASHGSGGTAEKPYYAIIWGKIPIGKIVDGAYVPTTNPAFLVVFDGLNECWILDRDAVIKSASFVATYQGTTLPFFMDTIELNNNQFLIENDTVIWYFEAKMYFKTQAEAEQTAEIMQQLISTGAIQNMKFIYETFVEKNLEFEE